MLLGAISLDLFAVLFGGVTAILPIFARDILHVGPGGLGLLRSGPSVGALLVGFGLMVVPLRRAGATMLWAVAGYGVATIVFGLSTHFWLSLAAMVGLGAFDMISVVVRQTMVQLATPDPMRGRVSAVNSVFIGASNHLGGLESGVVASLIGAAPSAVVGGFGALAIVALAAWLVPELGRVDALSRLEPDVPLGDQERTPGARSLRSPAGVASQHPARHHQDGGGVRGQSRGPYWKCSIPVRHGLA